MINEINYQYPGREAGQDNSHWTACPLPWNQGYEIEQPRIQLKSTFYSQVCVGEGVRKLNHPGQLVHHHS